MLRATVIAPRAVAHDEEISTVGHLDELRTRLIASLIVIAVAFGFCFWQNHRLLHLSTVRSPTRLRQQVRAGHGPLGATYAVPRTRATSRFSCARW